MRLSIQEIVELANARNAMIDEGYDYDTASQRAWDCLYAGRRGQL